MSEAVHRNRIQAITECLIGVIPISSIQAQLHDQQERFEQLYHLTDAVIAVQQHRTLLATTLSLCNELVQRWNLNHASFGLVKGRKIHVIAMANTSRVKRHMQVINDLERAMEECIDQEEPVIWQAVNQQHDAATINRAAELYIQQHQKGGIISLPMILNQRRIGVLSIETAAGQTISQESLHQCIVMTDMLAGTIDSQQRAERGWWHHSAQTLWSAIKWTLGKEHTGAKLIGLILTGLIYWITMIPTAYQTYGQTTVIAQGKREIVAPFAGTLHKVHIKDGEEISSVNQLVAEFETVDLNLQRTAKLAEQLSFQREADRARAQYQPAEQAIALAKADRVQADIDLLHYQIGLGRVTAPITGTVLAPNLALLEGTQIPLGKTLLTIVPANSLAVDIAVDQSQITDIRLGMAVTFTPSLILNPPSHVSLIAFAPPWISNKRETITLLELR